MLCSGVVWFMVQTSSLGPHLPQFLYFSAASRMSWRVIFRAAIEFPLTKGQEAAGIQPVRADDASPTGNVPAQCYDEKNWEETNALNNKTHHRRPGAVRAGAWRFACNGGRLSRSTGHDPS